MGSIVSYLLGSDSATDDENDAAGGNEDVTTIRSLLLQVPESSEEQTPQQWDAILQHIENHPEEAALFCHGQESSPLSIAATLNPPTAVIRSLLEAYDDAACFTDENDDTVLLCSLMNGPTSLDDIEIKNPSKANTLLILDANPMAASVPNKATGRLPLHYATSVSVASALVREHPAGITTRDGQGRIPLHWSVDPDGKRGGVSPALVEYLIQQGQKRVVHTADEVKEGKCSTSDANNNDETRERSCCECAE